jgi:hypothetical protein
VTDSGSKAPTSDDAVSEKTSQTHPLEIHVVSTPGGGRIGMTLCPGKRQPHAITGPWNRDLVADMDVISSLGTGTMITLMETAEMADAGVPPEVMESTAKERAIAWLHMPIADFAAPDAVFEAAWKERGPSVRKGLKNGASVVVHCRGGRGRAGLMAARLLVEMGLDADAAITAVRAANPLAIETVTQEDHIRQCHPQPE